MRRVVRTLLALCLVCFSAVLGLPRAAAAVAQPPECGKPATELRPPQFLVVSAAKTGSTSLYSYLCQHPNITCAAKNKELNWLRDPGVKVGSDRERAAAYAAYMRFGFPGGVPEGQVTFEASIHYYHHQAALRNVVALLPCARIVWILRNPAPRALSEYLHQAVKKWPKYPTYARMVEQEVRVIKRCRESVGNDPERGFNSRAMACYRKAKLMKYPLSTGFYATFIHAWLEKVPREHMFFLDYDFFLKKPKRTVDRLAEFLGLPPMQAELDMTWKYNKANTRDEKSTRIRNSVRLSPSLRRAINHELRPYVEELYKLVGEDFGWKLDTA